MSIEFFKSETTKINDYVELYRRCFKDFPRKKNKDYFDWLYNQNPLGNFIGIDCIDTTKNFLVGQVGGIPYEFNYNGKKVKIIQPMNVCVDYDYRGQKLFSKMAQNFETIAKEHGYDFIIGVANKAATVAWQQSLSIKKFDKLEVLITYGSLGMKNLSFDEKMFYSNWDKDFFNWRVKNPANKVYLEKKNNFILVSSKSVLSVFQIFTYLKDKNFILDKKDKYINFLLPKLFVGFVPENKDKKFFFKIPEFLKPSPLNFFYKDLKEENNIIETHKCFFSYLDFDAY
jgi:hypothetical protein